MTNSIQKYENGDRNIGRNNLSTFRSLVEDGSVAEAIQMRIDAIESAAISYKTDMEASKFSSLTLAVMGLAGGAVVAGSSPVIAALGGLGALSYAWTLYQDASKVKKIYPLPVIRKTITQLIDSFKTGEDDNEPEDVDDPIDEIAAFVDPEMSHEYRFIVTNEFKLIDFLSKFAPAARADIYRAMLRYTRIKNTLKLPSMAELRREMLGEDESPYQVDSVVSEPKYQPPTEPKRIEAIEVESTPVEDRKIVEEEMPEYNFHIKPEINVHNHIPREPERREQQTRSANPPQHTRRIDAPDLSLYFEPKERMQVLLKAMAESGFPIGKLLNHPFVWCYGRSQSGKTTFAMMLAIARLVVGNKISYFSTDTDYPKLKWNRLEDSAEGYYLAVDEVKNEIEQANKNGLLGTGYVWDEMFAAASEHEIDINPLISMILMKGAKTKATTIGIAQSDTSSSLKLKGLDEAWRNERVSVQAIHYEDELGDRHPTGRYVVKQADRAEEWSIPEWMLTELNQYGEQDPVAWMMRYFPEASGAVASQREQVSTAVQPEQADRASLPITALIEELPPMVLEVLKEAAIRDRVVASELQAETRFFRTCSSEQIRECFNILSSLSLGTITHTARTSYFTLDAQKRQSIIDVLKSVIR